MVALTEKGIAMARSIGWMSLLAALASGCGGGSGGDPVSTAAPAAKAATAAPTRSFAMGLHPLIDRWSEDDQELFDIFQDTYAQTAAHSDLMGHQIPEGVPWVEVAAGDPLGASVQNSLERRVALSSGLMYLGLNPLNGDRDGLAPYWGPSVLPPEWEDPAFDDPLVVSTYIQFCEDMIALFEPDYFAYAIEPNMVAREGGAPDDFPALMSLLTQTYDALKLNHPDLLVFVTLQVDYTLLEPEGQADAIDQLLAISDMVAISTYPWFIPVLIGAQEPGELPLDWFERFADLAPEKPFCVAETAGAGADLDLPGLGLFVPATENHQAGYLAYMLGEAQRLDMEFVAWLTLNDLDNYLSDVPELPSEIFDLLSIFKDMGLHDEEGQCRSCLAIWDMVLARDLVTDE
jgi:hypothetical protein